MFKSRHFPYMSGLLFFVFSMAAHAQPQEKILQKHILNTQQQTQFCRQFESFCIDGKVSRFFKVKNQKTQFYAIHALKLAEIQQDAQGFELINQWNFRLINHVLKVHVGQCLNKVMTTNNFRYSLNYSLSMRKTMQWESFKNGKKAIQAVA